MRPNRSLLLLPLWVACLALAITGWLWAHEQRAMQRLVRADFDFTVRQTASRIEQRLASYEQVLRGLQGLYNASAPVGAARFGRYVDALLAGADFSGIQWLAHASRQPGGPAAAGSQTNAPRSAPLSAIAPRTGAQPRAVGDDLWADPASRAALLLAQDSGGVGISARLSSATDNDPAAMPGFLMCLPLYAPGQPVDTVAARRAALVGWVLASVRMADLMSSLYGEGTPGTELRVHDGAEASRHTLIYGPAPGPDEARPTPLTARLEAHEYIGHAGHTWTLVLTALPAFEQRLGGDSALIIAVAGIGLSLLLALLTRQLLSGRARAHHLASAMTGELRASEARYRRIVEATDEGIWVTDAQGRTTFANPKMARLLGLPASALLGRTRADFIDEASPAGARDAPGRRDRHELRFRRQDGGLLWASVVSHPISDAETAPDSPGSSRVLTMVTDITDKKRADATQAQLEAQLREAQKMQAIGTLAGGIAHDFNNILAAIMGNLSLAQQQPGLDAATQAHLAQINTAAVRARDLVQQILAFSRRQPHRLLNQPLRPLVDDVVRLMRPLLPAGVVLDTHLAAAPDARPLAVAADASQLAQVVMNLCTNAWHALGGQAGRISVGLAPATLAPEQAQRLGLLPGPHAHLWVADTGSGMDAATQARVFEPFFTTKPVGQGTGLGLSVVHGILATHHGAITVHSAPGQGSRFDVYLPLVSPLPAAPALAAPGAEPAPSAGRHVLYVDDDPVMVLVAQGLLRQAGYRVTAFDDPLAAWAALQAGPDGFDLVVTDYNMPGLSGLDIAHRVAGLRPGLPVVVSSGYVSDALLADAAQAGVRQVMQKEYTLEQLTGIVNRLLATPACLADLADLADLAGLAHLATPAAR